MKSLLALILALLTFSAQAQSVPILMFHHISADDKAPAPESVQAGRFEEYLQMLAHNGYTTVTVSELASAIKRGKLPQKTVAITFDDGWRTNIQAVALLEKYRMKATLYILSSTFQYGDYLSKEEVAKLARKPNIEIGAHTHTHLMVWGPEEAKLDTMYNETIVGEMWQSKHLIEQVIGKPVTSFAWPFGYVRPAARDLAPAMGFTSIVETNRISKNTADISPLKLQRLNIDGHCTAAQVQSMIETGVLDKCK